MAESSCPPPRAPKLLRIWQLLNGLAQPPWPTVLGGLVVIGFLGLSLWRFHPYADDVTPALSRGDDWLDYETNALSILHEGLAMPNVPESYRRPGGFLYNYFVAAVYAVLGERSGYVYVVQGALLGISVVALFQSLRPYFSPPAGVLLLGALPLFLYANVYRDFTRRLLSENLAIPLVALGLWALLAAAEKRSRGRLITASVLLGLAVLTRPNLIVFALAAVLLVWRFWGPNAHEARAAAFLSLATLMAVLSGLVLRDYSVTGALGLQIWRYTDDYQLPAPGPGGTASPAGVASFIETTSVHYGRRVLFCLGLTRVLEPKIGWRLHWLPLWAGFALFVLQRTRRPPLFWEATLLAFTVCYLAPLVAVAQISNYGVRMVVPVMPIVLALSVSALDAALGWSPRGR